MSTTTTPGFIAPGMSPTGLLRHNTNRLLGSLKGLLPRLEEDIAARTDTSPTERIRIHGLRDSMAKTLERVAAVEAALRATA